VWNLNTDLDNIPACEQWAKMLRKNIDDLDKAIVDAEFVWVGLSNGEMIELSEMKLGSWDLILEVEAKLKERNT